MRALVVGGGFGGLAAAIRLAAAGHEVTLLDRRDRLGGRAYRYDVDGFRFDAGPTVLTAPFMFEELFALAGETLEEHVELVPLDPFYRVFSATGERFDFRAGEADLAAEVAGRSPGDREGFLALRARIGAIFDAFYPYTERDMTRLTVMLRMLPFLVRHRALRDVQSLVDAHVRDPFLRQSLSFHPLLIGGHPSRTPSLYSLIVEFERRWGVHYARGGTAALVDALGDLLVRLGGEVRCGVEVERILTRGGRAVGVRAGGEDLPADVVVSNADPGHTYGTLLAHEPSLGAARLRQRTARPSMSLHVVYLGADRTWPDTPLAHHTMLMPADPRGVLGRVFPSPLRPLRRVAANDHFMYVHLPTLTDPTLAPPGGSSLYVLVAAPPLPSRSRTAPADEALEAVEAARVRDAVVARLSRDFLPGLESSIVAEHAIGPAHFRDVLSTPRGAAFSAQPTLLQSGWFRTHPARVGLEGLYLVGAGLHPGAGVPAVLASAKIATGIIAARADRSGTRSSGAVAP